MYTFIGGPCVIEGRDHTLRLCDTIKKICDDLEIPFIFKSSFDKANRSSINSFRGPGIEEGLSILREIKNQYSVDVVTDIHEPWQANIVAEVVDYIQIPAFLCRQTDLIVAAGKTKKNIIIKKGQFLSGKEMKTAVQKVYSTDNHKVILAERGTMFGYDHLIVDIRNIVDMKKIGVPVMFDATHSVQCRDMHFDYSGGNPQYIVPYVKAIMALGIDFLFMEVHDDPERALSDGKNMLDLSLLKNTLAIAKAIDGVSNEVRSFEQI